MGLICLLGLLRVDREYDLRFVKCYGAHISAQCRFVFNGILVIAPTHRNLKHLIVALCVALVALISFESALGSVALAQSSGTDSYNITSVGALKNSDGRSENQGGAVKSVLGHNCCASHAVATTPPDAWRTFVPASAQIRRLTYSSKAPPYEPRSEERPPRRVLIA